MSQMMGKAVKFPWVPVHVLPPRQVGEGKAEWSWVRHACVQVLQVWAQTPSLTEGERAVIRPLGQCFREGWGHLYYSKEPVLEERGQAGLHSLAGSSGTYLAPSIFTQQIFYLQQTEIAS